ncbi:hypothetical protein E6H35_09315 [Candidatus Bathyarchaeota archaeon]|nr:MAG: hypothetical protein E6H35_09315 [Candidatus Bathyarchaeota archaeon]
MKLGFGKTKQKDPPLELNAQSAVANRLKELCGGDGDLYKAMSHLMFLDPKKIIAPLDQVLTEAQGFEAQGNKLRAEVGYRIAGGISLYKGDLDGVRKYFEKAASFAGDSHPEYQTILKRSDDAVNIARKYYDEFGSFNAQSQYTT